MTTKNTHQCKEYELGKGHCFLLNRECPYKAGRENQCEDHVLMSLHRYHKLGATQIIGGELSPIERRVGE